MIVYVQKNVSINTDQLDKHIGAWMKVMGLTVQEALKDQARLLCLDMLDITPPYQGATPQTSSKGGRTLDARQKGQNLVARDIHRIFQPLRNADGKMIANEGKVQLLSAWLEDKARHSNVTPGSLLSKWIEKRAFVTQYDMDLFRRQMGVSGQYRSFDTTTNGATIPGTHEAIRGKPWYKIPSFTQFTYVENYDAVERYVKKKQTRVGYLKSGWFWAGKNIQQASSPVRGTRSKKLPSFPDIHWISKHDYNNDILKDNTGNPTVKKISVGNRIGKLDYRYSQFQMAIDHRAYAMRMEMGNALKGDMALLWSMTSHLQGFGLIRNP